MWMIVCVSPKAEDCNESIVRRQGREERLEWGMRVVCYTPGRGKIVPRNYTPGWGKIVPRNVNNL